MLESDNWWTPEYILDVVRAVLGPIPLDPCTDKSNPTKASSFLTVEDNALQRMWAVPYFCNPPYSQASKWIEYALMQYVPGLLLVPADTSTKMVQALMRHHFCCFLAKRPKFIDPKTGNPSKQTGRKAIMLALVSKPGQETLARVFCDKANTLGLVSHRNFYNPIPFG